MMKDTIENPWRSAHVVCIGDSHTWGVDWVVSGSGLLTDPRDPLASESWVNRLRRELGLRMCGSQGFTEPAAGKGKFTSQRLLDICDDPLVATVSTATGEPVAPVVYIPSADAGVLKRYMDLQPGTEIRFNYTGTRIDVLYATQTTASSPFDVRVDGATVTTGDTLAVSSAWNVSLAADVPFGEHAVRIINTGANYVRLQGIVHHRTVQVDNQGLIGTWTHSWRPGGPLLEAAVPASTTHVVICLGFNDRGNRAQIGPSEPPDNPARTRKQLGAILTWLETTRPGAAVMLIAPHAATAAVDWPDSTSHAYSTADVGAVVARLAREREHAFCDVYSTTRRLIDNGEPWLRDAIHANAFGHGQVFETVLKAMEAQ